MDVWNILVGTDSDENLPILNKIKHPKEKRHMMEAPKLATKKIVQRGWIVRGMGTNQIFDPFPPPPSQYKWSDFSHVYVIMHKYFGKNHNCKN
jgi:hypothetical protein